MTYALSVARVRDGFDTGLGDIELSSLITFAGGADACMTTKQVPDDTGILLKLYLVRHMATLNDNSGRGNAIAESAPSGASRTFAQRTKPGTGYMDMLDQMDRWGCVKALLRRGGAAFVRGVGP